MAKWALSGSVTSRHENGNAQNNYKEVFDRGARLSNETIKSDRFGLKRRKFYELDYWKRLLTFSSSEIGGVKDNKVENGGNLFEGQLDVAGGKGLKQIALLEWSALLRDGTKRSNSLFSSQSYIRLTIETGAAADLHAGVSTTVWNKRGKVSQSLLHNNEEKVWFWPSRAASAVKHFERIEPKQAKALWGPVWSGEQMSLRSTR